jgi:hypothetical protein
MKYKAYAVVSGSRYLGEFEANSKEEADEMVRDTHEGEMISLCWQCSKEVDDLTVTENIEIVEVD